MAGVATAPRAPDPNNEERHRAMPLFLTAHAMVWPIRQEHKHETHIVIAQGMASSRSSIAVAGKSIRQRANAWAAKKKNKEMRQTIPERKTSSQKSEEAVRFPTREP